jgi:hypothetical protein
MPLTTENYTQGFLIDDELMAGVTTHPEQPGRFVAFILTVGLGEYVGYDAYDSLEEALGAINRIPRTWTFEQTSGCGEGGCQGGNCGTGLCPKKKSNPQTDACAHA